MADNFVIARVDILRIVYSHCDDLSIKFERTVPRY